MTLDKYKSMTREEKLDWENTQEGIQAHAKCIQYWGFDFTTDPRLTYEQACILLQYIGDYVNYEKCSFSKETYYQKMIDLEMPSEIVDKIDDLTECIPYALEWLSQFLVQPK